MADIAFVKVDIAGLVMEYAQMGGGAAPDAVLAEWFRGLVGALVRRDGSEHAYAASLLGEAEGFRQADAQRKARAKAERDAARAAGGSSNSLESKESKISAESLERPESLESVERHYIQTDHTDHKKREEAASGDSMEISGTGEKGNIGADNADTIESAPNGFSPPLVKKRERVTKRDEIPFMHEWLEWEPFRTAWDGWLDMRRKKRNAPTERAKALAMADLERLTQDADEAIQIVNKSAVSGWAGFFAPQGQKQAATGSKVAEWNARPYV